MASPEKQVGAGAGPQGAMEASLRRWRKAEGFSFSWWDPLHSLAVHRPVEEVKVGPHLGCQECGQLRMGQYRLLAGLARQLLLPSLMVKSWQDRGYKKGFQCPCDIGKWSLLLQIRKLREGEKEFPDVA